MVRRQIQLTPQPAERLRRTAHARGVSISALVREAIDAVALDSGREWRHRRALAQLGAFRSGGGDGSADHDRHLAKAYRT